METLKLIPQLFYDLIARVIPGLTAIAAFSFAADIKMGMLLSGLFEGSKTLQESTFVLSTTAIFCAYLIGHFIGILSDLFERRIARKLFPSFFHNLKSAITATDGRYSPELKNFFIKKIGFNQKKVDPESISDGIYTTSIFVWYDWLRVNDPDAGARAAKVRAEYRMHGGISVVMILTIIMHGFSIVFKNSTFNIYLIVVSSVIGAFSLWGLARTYRMFQWNVMNQYYVTKIKSSSAKEKLTKKPMA
jgi:hypothetical protein